MNKKLEICCYSIPSAIDAEKAGADRIEFCDNYSEGGTTPSFAAIEFAINIIQIPTNIIIRPRGGDFLYSDTEFDIIKKDVVYCNNMGANGIVIGFLTSNGDIDIDKTKEIIDLADGMEVTFHRAFDMCNNPHKAIELLSKLGVYRVLSSGGRNTAMEGIDDLRKLVSIAGNDIKIMPGSGINDSNLEKIINTTKANEYHSSAKIFIESKMQYYNRNIYMGGENSIGEYSMISVNKEMIYKMKEIIKRY
ncbi:MAG: copper homeostasis protein CutC [Bacteroidales bacterium]|nr:copper homeostasis protein CutC [Bacteroidales bacterium]